MRYKQLNFWLVIFCVIYGAVAFYMYNGFQRRLERLSELNGQLIQFASLAAAPMNPDSDEAVLADELLAFLPLYSSEAVTSAFKHVVEAVDGEISVSPGEPEAIDAFSLALPLQFEFTGSFNDALKVVGLIETEGQLVRIETVRLARSPHAAASHNVKLWANMRLIFSTAYAEDAAVHMTKNITPASASLVVPQRKMHSKTLFQAISHIKNPFQRSIANLTLKAMIPWKENEFAAVLELDSGESFTLVPGESFKGIGLDSASANGVVVSMLGQLFALELSP